MLNRFFLALILIFIPSLCLGAAPVVFFSDLTDGPITGWEESTTKGAAVSIWGLNFGASGSVAVGGQTLSSADSTQVAEWAATTNPTTARGLQRITFFLNSSMSTGATTISVTTSEGASTTIPFSTRALGSNHIYFVTATGGSDNNSGLSTSAQWATFEKARTVAAAGDVVYFRAGTYTSIDSMDSTRFPVLSLRTSGGVSNHANGTANNSISFCAYPGEVAQIGDGTADSGKARKFLVRNYNTNPDTLAYWTFSKFKLYTYGTAIAYEFGNAITVDNYVRYVGMDATTTFADTGTGIIINPYGNTDNLKILGNYLHHSGRGGDPESAYSYKVEPIYLGGGGDWVDTEVGWNELYNNNGTLQVYAHYATDTFTNLIIHDNLVTYAGTATAVIGGGDPAGTDYNPIVSAKIYNNIFANNQSALLLLGGYHSRGGDFEVYNNVFYNNALSAGTSRELNMFNVTSLTWRNNIIYAGAGSTGGYYTSYNGISALESTEGFVSDHNIWYGQPTAPDWDSSTLDDTDPLMVAPSTGDYMLQSSSPAVGVGMELNSIFMGDFLGVTRGATWDIGTFEYAAATDTTAPTITTAAVNGTTVTITADETIVTTGYDANDCALICTTAGTVNLTSPAGTGASRTLTGSANVANGDTCTLGCTLATGDITDAADPANDMVTFSGLSVTVNTPMAHGGHFGPSSGGGWRKAAGQIFAPAM